MKGKRRLINRVADLLANELATSTDFMFDVGEELRKKGYELECHQKGVQGTEVLIVKTNNGGHNVRQSLQTVSK